MIDKNLINYKKILDFVFVLWYNIKSSADALNQYSIFAPVVKRILQAPPKG